MIAIINYGIGNTLSVQNMFRRIGIPAVVTSDPFLINEASRLVLPGVGSFDAAMNSLEKHKLIDILDEMVMYKKKPILGICLGMHLFGKSSEEGSKKGLGWLNADVVRFNRERIKNNLKIPNMGWRHISYKKDEILFSGLFEPKFYFVHSYHMECKREIILSKSTYGYDFVCGVKHKNIIGTQFHPEKSHKFGLLFLKNFATYDKNI